MLKGLGKVSCSLVRMSAAAKYACDARSDRSARHVHINSSYPSELQGSA